MLPYIEARIIRIEPITEYEGRIYDQAVYLELADGKIIDVFDYKVIAKPQMLDKTKKITIDVGIARVDKIFEHKYGIELPVEHNRPTGQGYKFFGKILEIDERRLEMTVDIGIGSILASPRRLQLPEFHVGDFVSVFSVRADLDSIQD